MELLVVVFILTIGLGILMPSYIMVRRKAHNVLTANSQYQIVLAVNSFAVDNKGQYPPSVATIGEKEGRWNWQGPNMLISSQKRDGQKHRALSEYLGSYIGEPEIMLCPSAPRKYGYFKEAWQKGDNWDNPDTLAEQDPLTGTFCFYWNYIGYIDQGSIFRGPRGVSSEKGYSTLLVSDYFGYGHWQNPKGYCSCEKMNSAGIMEGTAVSSAYWSCSQQYGKKDFHKLGIKLNAGYTDGHVESFELSELIPMKVSISSDGSTPYPEGLGPGVFYIPANSLY